MRQPTHRIIQPTIRMGTMPEGELEYVPYAHQATNTALTIRQSCTLGCNDFGADLAGRLDDSRSYKRLERVWTVSQPESSGVVLAALPLSHLRPRDRWLVVHHLCPSVVAGGDKTTPAKNNFFVLPLSSRAPPPSPHITVWINPRYLCSSTEMDARE